MPVALRKKEMAARIGRRKLLVVMGGLSPEREISLATGRAVLQALRAEGLNAEGLDLKTRKDLLRVIKHRPGVVVNALHGTSGEDGVIQGVFEWFGLAYTGSGVLASALAMNKHLAKQLMRSAGLPTAPWRCWSAADPLPSKLKFPLVVKPNRQGSAIGVSIVRKQKELANALTQAQRFGTELLLEQYLPGREISVAVLDGKALPIIEIVPKNAFYDYEAKYQPGMAEHIIPARLSEALTREAQHLAESTARVFGCQGTPRIDMIVSRQGKINILEVNTLPGMTATSLLPDAAKHAGISFVEVVMGSILEAWGEKL